MAGEARNAEELTELLQKTTPDLVMLDVNLSDKSGLEILKDIKLVLPRLPVLILSIYPENEYAQRFLKAGASGYINKDREADEFIMAVKTIMKGTKYISPAMAENIFLESERKNKKKIPHDFLSDREFEVFRFLFENKTISEIANIFFLSVKTISTYKARIFKKLNVKNLDELKKYADYFNLFRS